jgi:hypothetical protein
VFNPIEKLKQWSDQAFDTMKNLAMKNFNVKRDRNEIFYLPSSVLVLIDDLAVQQDTPELIRHLTYLIFKLS